MDVMLAVASLVCCVLENRTTKVTKDLMNILPGLIKLSKIGSLDFYHNAMKNFLTLILPAEINICKCAQCVDMIDKSGYVFIHFNKMNTI